MADKKCGTCGAPMRLLSSMERGEENPAGERGFDRLTLAGICSNPDCPTVDSDLAPVANGT